MKIYLDAYLNKNLGDDLFIDILLKRYPNHKFFSISKGQKYKLNNLKVYSNSYLYRALKKFELEKYIANRCDIVVTIGGSMYIENNDKDRDFTLGKNKRYILGSNFGPYQSIDYYNNLYEVFKEAEDVCFREKYSYELFRDLPNIRYASDIVFAMDTKGINIIENKRAIISVIDCKRKINEKYQETYEDTIIKMIKYLIDKNYSVCLMSFCKEENDEEAINRIVNKLDSTYKEKVDKYFYDGNIEDALNNIGNSNIVIGSRFHAIILGLLLNKSILPIIYSDKTKHVLEENDIDAKIIEIKNLDKFDISILSETDLVKRYDIADLKNNAQKHFEKLDLILKE